MRFWCYTCVMRFLLVCICRSELRIFVSKKSGQFCDVWPGLTGFLIYAIKNKRGIYVFVYDEIIYI